MKTCFLFPGQGAQYAGMGRDLWEASDGVKELFRIASDTSGMDMRKLLFECTDEDLRQTDKTQIAVTLVDLSAARILSERGIVADGCAGFSLGEYAALTVSGILREEDVFPLVKLRGIVMEKASRALDSDGGSPGMAAVIGLSPERIAELAEGIEGVFAANFNSPVQTVVSGTASGLAAFEPVCKQNGAKRFIRLSVSGPFHSPLLASARDAFAEAVEKIGFRDPVLPVWSNVTGKRISTGAEAKSFCIAQIVSPVRWVEEEAAILQDGYERCIEAGPGMVLGGLWKAVSSTVPCVAAGKLDDIQKISGV